MRTDSSDSRVSASPRILDASRNVEPVRSQSTIDYDSQSVMETGSTFGSVFGHDDPTAIMTNIRRSDRSVLKCLSTNDSLFVENDCIEEEDESRDPVEDDLEENTSREVPENYLVKRLSTRPDLSNQLSELDRTEEQWQARMSMQSSSSFVSTDKEASANVYMEEAGSTDPSISKRIRPTGNNIVVDDLDDTPKLLGNASSESNDSLQEVDDLLEKGKVEPVPTCQSQSQSQPLSEGAFEAGDSTKDEDGIPGSEIPEEAETEEIVRQVQQRLTKLSVSEGAASNNIQDSKSPPSSPRKARGSYWIPVVEEPAEKTQPPRGASLASKSDLSIDEEEQEYFARCCRRHRKQIICVILLVILIVGMSIVIYFLVTSKHSTRVNQILQQTAPPEFRLRGSKNPSTSPPTSSPAPTPSTLEYIRKKLFQISGDSLYDLHSPQYQALNWLVNYDPSTVDITTVPYKTLEERYVLALFHFAMTGKGWKNQYGFLNGTSVCNWNNGIAGVFCDANTNDGYFVSAIIISEFALCFAKAAIGDKRESNH